MVNKFYGELYLLPEGHTHTCTKSCKNNDGWGNIEKWTCGKPAVYGSKNGLNFFCRHHSGMGRYIVRNGDVGEIIARFNSEQELRDNIHLYPGMEMQMVTNGKRRSII